MFGTHAISTTSRRELSSSFFFLQGKAPKEIHAILTEKLACFLSGRAKDLSAPCKDTVAAKPRPHDVTSCSSNGSHCAVKVPFEYHLFTSS